MSLIRVKTNGNASPQGKSRVYVTCHPSDVELWFEKICKDIFKAQDCAVYYTEDMTAEIPEEDKETDLGQMNLFVIPVTFKLLTTKNRCIDSDFPYAVEKHIPVLPIMMEDGIDEFYRKRFGERQYLNPFSGDSTEIGYEEKLNKYLRSVLVDDKTAARIRAAFDAYIFLSYRKKDRRYANELMRLIHSHPLCRDIAIWYDEFLTPGENFNSTIAAALLKSDLFAMLVTPNLINEENYVRSTEYPAAKEVGKDILPVEMEKTDAAELTKQFEGIPPTVDGRSEEEFRARLLDSISKIARASNDDDPAHNFLIGLAYLDGIDVEVDRSRALQLITSAAEAGLPEAMGKLATMYGDGSGAAFNPKEAIKWHRRILDYMVKAYGEKHPDTLIEMNNLASAYDDAGDYAAACELLEKAYELSCEVLGKRHPNTLTLINSLANVCVELGEYERALISLQVAYKISCEVCGETDEGTLSALNNLAIAHKKLGGYEAALDLQNKVYKIRCETVGERHPATLTALHNLAGIYGDINDNAKACELYETLCKLNSEVLGERHPHTLITLSNLAHIYDKLGDHKKALALQEQAYAALCEVLGEHHPNTLMALSGIEDIHYNMGDYETALKLLERVYAERRAALGEAHHDTLTSLNNLAGLYGLFGDFGKMLETHEKAYNLLCESLGERHPDTLIAMSNLAVSYLGAGNTDGVALQEKAFNLSCEVLGETHPETLKNLDMLLQLYDGSRDYAKRRQLYEKTYDIYCEVFGETHQYTLTALNAFATDCYRLGDYAKAVESQEKLCGVLRETAGETTAIIAPLSNLAIMYEDMGNLEEAVRIREEVYSLARRLLGDGHSDTLLALNRLSVNYYQTANYHAALELMERAYKLNCEVRGGKHQNTLTALVNLAGCHFKLENYAEAVELQEKAYNLYLEVFGEDNLDTVKASVTLDKYKSKI